MGPPSPRDGSGSPPWRPVRGCSDGWAMEDMLRQPWEDGPRGGVGPAASPDAAPCSPPGTHPDTPRSSGHLPVQSHVRAWIPDSARALYTWEATVLSAWAFRPATLAVGHPVTLGAMAHDHVMVDGTRTAPHAANTACSQAGSRGTSPPASLAPRRASPAPTLGWEEGRDAMSCRK